MPRAALLLALFAVLPTPAPGDEPDSPYQAQGRDRPGAARVYKDRITPHWFAEGTRFWYRNDLKGGTREFVLVDAEKGTKAPAFDHKKLAAALSKASRQGVRRRPTAVRRDRVSRRRQGGPLRGRRRDLDLRPEHLRLRPWQPRVRRQETGAEERSARPAGRGRVRVPLDDRGRSRPAAPATEVARPLGPLAGRQVDRTHQGRQRLPPRRRRQGDRTHQGRQARPRLRDALLVAGLEGPGRAGGSSRATARRSTWSSPPRRGAAGRSCTPGPTRCPGDKLTSFEPHLFDVPSGKEIPCQADKVDFGTPAGAVGQGRPHLHLPEGGPRPPAVPLRRGGRPHRQGPQPHRRAVGDVHLDRPHRERQRADRHLAGEVRRGRSTPPSATAGGTCT